MGRQMGASLRGQAVYRRVPGTDCVRTVSTSSDILTVPSSKSAHEMRWHALDHSSIKKPESLTQEDKLQSRLSFKASVTTYIQRAIKMIKS